MNAQYTLSRSRGNTSGSNEALTAGNAAQTLADFDYDLGYNNFDVRHTFNLSALYSIPYGRGRETRLRARRALLGGWDVGGIVNARSGLPIDVRITRPDVVYVDGAGNFQQPGGRPHRGHQHAERRRSRNVRRPDLVPGVDPFITGRRPAVPEPGGVRDAAAGHVRQSRAQLASRTGFAQLDLVLASTSRSAATRNVEFRIEVFNLFNRANFSNPVATLPNALPTTALTEANRVQPGQPFTGRRRHVRDADEHGRPNRRSRHAAQVQFAFRLNF